MKGSEKQIEYAKRALERAVKHLDRFVVGGKFYHKPEHFRKEAEEEVTICRDRLEKLIYTNEKGR